MAHDREPADAVTDVGEAVPATVDAPSPFAVAGAGLSNAAIARRAASRAPGGSRLPSSAEGALRTLGGDASAVRVHTGPAADAELASRPGALAMTQGTDIHVGSAAPALDSPGGRLLLAHEAAHVVQQQAGGPAVSRETAEAQADQAAVAASLGQPVPALSAASGPLYFEAQWHQASITGALNDLGFTEAEQEQAYFGNWCRDFSQAFVPMMRDSIGSTAAFELVNLAAMLHFGHGVTPEQLGGYNPVEHIDNPAGQTDRDVLSSATVVGAGTAAGADAESLSPGHIAEAFAVGASGVPEYIERSRRYIEAEATAAIAAGRTAEGLFHAGNFSHTCEDLFAHSNWIEIAVGQVVSERPGLIPAGTPAAEEVAARLRDGLPPIENYAADVRDAAGRARPILATGTFSGGGAGNDTIISLREELQNVLRDRAPFSEGGSSGRMYDVSLEILRHIDASAEEGTLGPIFTEIVEQAASNAGGGLVSAAAGLPGRARSLFGDGVFGDVAEGAAGLVADGAEGAVGLAGDAWRAGLHEAVSSAVQNLGAIHMAEFVVWAAGEANAVSETWDSMVEFVRGLPDEIASLILPAMITAERELKARVRELGNAAYGRGVELLLAQLDTVTVADTAETNVEVKREHWQAELDQMRAAMATQLEEVGGPDGAALAAQVRTMSTEELIGFAQSAAFQNVLAGLASDVATRVLLQNAAGALDTQANSVAQLDAVPAWARAGASHSQLAKDHDDSPMFGVAFAVARHADDMLLGELRTAWERAGSDGSPAPGLGDRYDGTKTGDEAEDARREAFLATRAAGAGVVAHGHAETQDIGPRLVAVADAIDAVIATNPLLRPTLAGLVAVLRANSSSAAVLAELEATRTRWEAEARSGRFDDAVMRQVDGALGQVNHAIRDALPDGEHEHDHEHGDRTGVAFQTQLDSLQSHRGEGAIEATAGVGADRLAPASEPMIALVRQIFNHPYEGDWWKPIVQAWCEQHPEVLAQAVHDRNAGVGHSHPH